jgi:hypothetical protein
MLDLHQVLKHMHAVAADYARMRSGQHVTSQQVWQQVLHDASMQELLLGSSGMQVLEPFCMHATAPSKNPYTVISIDGSQIYPDRHEGIDWYLLAIGQVTFTYGAPTSSFMPVTYTYLKTNLFAERAHDERAVDAERVVLEQDHALAALQAGDAAAFVMVDGPLAELAGVAHARKLAIVGYTSSPQARDLARMLQQLLPQMAPSYDAELFGAVQAGGGIRTPFFALSGQVFAFCYLITETEIARVELPLSVAHDEQLRDRLMAGIVDQAAKGGGYPVCLAEAHHQAVVTSDDRAAFYHYARMALQEHGYRVQLSSKAAAKRRLRV